MFKLPEYGYFKVMSTFQVVLLTNKTNIFNIRIQWKSAKFYSENANIYHVI